MNLLEKYSAWMTQDLKREELNFQYCYTEMTDSSFVCYEINLLETQQMYCMSQDLKREVFNFQNSFTDMTDFSYIYNEMNLLDIQWMSKDLKT